MQTVFFSVKVRKQTKNCDNISEGLITNSTECMQSHAFVDRRQLKAFFDASSQFFGIRSSVIQLATWTRNASAAKAAVAARVLV